MTEKIAGNSRREFLRHTGAAALSLAALPFTSIPFTSLPLGGVSLRAKEPSFRLEYIVASCMYGTSSVSEILPELKKTGAEHIDIWPRVHGSQREEVEAMGHDAFLALLEKHHAKLGVITRYDLGPFRLTAELKVARKLGARIVVCGSKGPAKLNGKALKDAVRKFATKLQPTVLQAEKLGVHIGIENHGGSLIQSADSMRWFVEFAKSKHVGIALAPYHLPQNSQLLAKLMEDLGPRLTHFYAWQHGEGCHKKLPKAQELLQMPGRGKLDFKPLLSALKKIEYRGWTEIFMHPVPRGISIMDTTSESTAEISRARKYLEKCLGGV